MVVTVRESRVPRSGGSASLMRAFGDHCLGAAGRVRFADRVPTEKERLDVVEPQVATLISHVGQLSAELERVTARLTVLERRLSGAGDGPLADLDAVADDIAPLVEALRRAWDAEQEILADPARVELRQEVLEFEGSRPAATTPGPSWTVGGCPGSSGTRCRTRSGRWNG